METALEQPIRFADLPEEKRVSVATFYQNLKLLIEFSNKANEKLFIYLYGERLGKHLWIQFRKIDNLFTFLNYLDIENRDILLANVYGYDRKVSAHPLYSKCL
jgi:hypothetical protein